jgi:26S proteasome regulatory subunit N1
VQVLELLTPIVHDFKVGIEVAGFAALSLGLVYVGSCNEDVAQSIILALMDRSEAELGEPLAHFLCLGLGLLYLGKQDAVDATMEVAKTLHEKISKFCQVTLDSCAYAGTGNVLKVLIFVLMSCWAMGLLCSQGGNTIL